MSRGPGATTYHQRLHALDVSAGAELLNGPVEISATYPMTGGIAPGMAPTVVDHQVRCLSGVYKNK